jgi:hypothetical protein
MGDVFPDFDSMTPEEQMAWLESLAKRQGVKDEELTTKADLDIPVPENAQVDEPGYVPFEGSASARRIKEAQEAAEVEAESEPAFEEQPEEPVLAEAEAESEPAIEEQPEEPTWAEAEAESEPAIEEQPEEPTWAEAEAESEPAIEEEPEEPILAEAESSVEEQPEELIWAEAETEAPLEEFDLFAEVGDAADSLDEFDLFAETDDVADPMLWLDGLSAQPEGDLGDLSDLFAESEAMTFEESEADLFEAEAQDQPESEEPAAQEASVAASDDDPLGGMDPMLWLESLAKRQGANMDELLTSANLNVQEVPEDAVVDEPGYVPFEGSASARKMKEAAEAAAVPPELIPEPEVGAEPEPAGEQVMDYSPPEAPEIEAYFDEQETALDSDGEAMLSGEDPMRWLESLAKRQGASEEEFLTDADLEIPELPEDTVIDEPGYVEYSPFSILPADQELELPEMGSVEDQLAELGVEDEALSWLEDLAAEPDEDVSEILAFGDEVFEPVAEEGEPEAPAVEERAVSDDPLAGMSDEEVAYAQAHGQLTGQQELEWLKRQAAKLAKVRESQEADQVMIEEEISDEIVPADLPPWLAQMREEAEQTGDEEVGVPGTEEVELAAESVDFSEWLEEVPAAEAEIDIAELALDTAELSEADVDSLWGETADTEFELEEPGLPDDSELAKFLAEGIVPEGADPLAEALDAEFERKLTGDESEPDWYTDAVAKAASETIEADVESAEEEAAAPLVEASQVDMPDWLRETDEEIESAIAGEEGMPDWLRETGEPEPMAQEVAPAWFEEEEAEIPEVPAAVEEELPDWLRELDKEPQQEIFESVAVVEPAAEAEPVVEPEPRPAPVPVPAPVHPAAAVEPEIRKPAPVQPVVQGERLEKISRRLQADPNDHASRLAFARALRDGQQVAPSLDQYESLIEAAQLLEDVANDLGSLAEAQPDTARVRRLLGDAHMRRGKLQEALDAYRSALEQL